GFFVNTLPLRIDLTGCQSFRELLRRTWKTTLEAYEHQDLPFARLVEEFSRERGFSRTPLVQVMFVLDPREQQWKLADLDLKREELDSGTAKFELTLFLRETDEGLQGILEYNTDLFDKS